MTERRSPTAVLREGPRALSDAQVREIEDSSLEQVLNVDIDDVIEYVHKDLRSLPDFTTLYRKYLKQRWDVYDLDFSQDKIDWQEKMTEEERQSFIAVASGFHHGERQVEIELPVFMIGASEEEKLHIAAQIEDEARHTVFFDRFYREVVGLKGDDIMDILRPSRGCPRRSSRHSACSRTRPTSCGCIRTTSGRGCATAPTTSSGSRACWRCR